MFFKVRLLWRRHFLCIGAHLEYLTLMHNLVFIFHRGLICSIFQSKWKCMKTTIVNDLYNLREWKAIKTKHWRRFFIEVLIVNKSFSNYRFISNQREAYFNWQIFLISMLMCIQIHAAQQLGINQNANRKSSSLYWNNCLPLYLILMVQELKEDICRII